VAVSAAVPARPRKPPSFFPRALLAANAAFVRAEIIPASSSVTKLVSCATADHLNMHAIESGKVRDEEL
jgi:hypothetical protein